MLLNDLRPGNDTVYKIQACSRESLPRIQSDLVQLCRMRQFADMCADDEFSGDEVYIGFVRCTDSHCQRTEYKFLYSGKVCDHPDVIKVLSNFADVRVYKLPSGSPESLGPDGKPIEHTLELAEVPKPFAAQPRRLSQDENAEWQKALTDLPKNGWKIPSSSPHVSQSRPGSVLSRYANCSHTCDRHGVIVTHVVVVLGAMSHVTPPASLSRP